MVKKKLSCDKIYKLIIKHHGSVLDSKKIKGFNGLTNLGKTEINQLKSVRKNLKNTFEYLRNKEINSKYL